MMSCSTEFCQFEKLIASVPGVSWALSPRTIKSTTDKPLLLSRLSFFCYAWDDSITVAFFSLLAYFVICIAQLVFGSRFLQSSLVIILITPLVLLYIYHIARGYSLPQNWSHWHESVENRVVVITGANTGMGRASLMQFVKWNAKMVIVGCRNMKQGEEAVKEANALASVLKSPTKVLLGFLDLSDYKTVQGFAQLVKSSTDELHILLNNAGVMIPPFTKTKHGHELQFGTNHMGHYILIKELLSLLKKSGTESNPSRVVNVSSLGHLFASRMGFRGERLHENNLAEVIANLDDYKTKPWSLYGLSKLCNIWTTKRFQDILDEEKCNTLKCYAVHPGGVRTDLQRHQQADLAEWVKEYLQEPIMRFLGKTPIQGAQTALYCCSAPVSHLNAGSYYSECRETISSPESYCKKCQAKLFEISESELKKAGIEFAD